MKQRRTRDPGRADAARSNPAGSPSGLIDRVSSSIAQARQLWASGDHTLALQILRGVMQSEPTNVRGYLDAARCYLRRFDIDRFHQTLQRLRNLAPAEPGVHHLAAEAYVDAKFLSHAGDCLEAAVARPGVLPNTLLAAAEYYERMNQLDKADGLLDRVLSARPDSHRAAFVRAKIRARRGELEVAEQSYRSLLETVPPSSELACETAGELAQVLDKKEDFAGAWNAIQHAHGPLLAKDGPVWDASEKVLDRFRHFLDSLSADDLDRWRNELPPDNRLNVAVLTGFPRSGTTLLEQVLDAHPGLTSVEERDVVAQHLLPQWHTSVTPRTPLYDVVNRLSTERLRHDRAAYHAIMASFVGQPIGNRVLLDKNPAYTPIIPLFLRLFPESKIIVALRDPRDVVLSCYLRYLPLNPVSVRFLTIERTVGRYLFDMQAWLRFRDTLQGSACEVRYEEAVNDLEMSVRQVLNLLGLPWDPAVLNYRDRLLEKGVNSPSYAAVQRPIDRSAIGRWKNYERFFGPSLDPLHAIAAKLGYTE